MRVVEFGVTATGETAQLYWLENVNGVSLAVSDFGATWVSLMVPDQQGDMVDVVLGFDNVKGYEESDTFLGAIVGRHANRIGKAAFTLNGQTYHLAHNNNDNNLHSGPDYYSKRMWSLEEASDERITFTLHSEDGDQGYPGNLDLSVTYELTGDNEVRIQYEGVADQDTVINMTNHSYFNLDGHDSGVILQQEVEIDADTFTKADAESIPTGDILSVEGTPMDFRQKKPLGQDIEQEYEALRLGNGYDHNYVLNHNDGYAKAAVMSGAKRGIQMEVYTDLPGMQLYTGNFIVEEHGKGGAIYGKRHGVCFETQYYPDAVNKQEFPSPVVKAGEVYKTVTGYKFYCSTPRK